MYIGKHITCAKVRKVFLCLVLVTAENNVNAGVNRCVVKKLNKGVGQGKELLLGHIKIPAEGIAQGGYD